MYYNIGSDVRPIGLQCLDLGPLAVQMLHVSRSNHKTLRFLEISAIAVWYYMYMYMTLYVYMYMYMHVHVDEPLGG